MDATSRRIQWRCSLGASRISDPLRRSDDHAAAGDMRERTGIALSKRPKPLRHVIMRAEAARETLRLPPTGGFARK